MGDSKLVHHSWCYYCQNSSCNSCCLLLARIVSQTLPPFGGGLHRVSKEQDRARLQLKSFPILHSLSWYSCSMVDSNLWWYFWMCPGQNCNPGDSVKAECSAQVHSSHLLQPPAVHRWLVSPSQRWCTGQMLKLYMCSSAKPAKF